MSGYLYKYIGTQIVETYTGNGSFRTTTYYPNQSEFKTLRYKLNNSHKMVEITEDEYQLLRIS